MKNNNNYRLHYKEYFPTGTSAFNTGGTAYPINDNALFTSNANFIPLAIVFKTDSVNNYSDGSTGFVLQDPATHKEVYIARVAALNNFRNQAIDSEFVDLSETEIPKGTYRLASGTARNNATGLRDNLNTNNQAVTGDCRWIFIYLEKIEG